MNEPGASIVRALGAPHHHVGFGVLNLVRMRDLIHWARDVVPGSNVVEEAIALSGASCSLTPFDIQRVFELVGVQAGNGVAMVFMEPEAKIVGAAVDYLLRSVARPDQAARCSARSADLMLELHGVLFADGAGARQAEGHHLARMAAAVGALGAAPVTTMVLRQVPEYARGPVAAYVARKDFTEAFGPARSSYRGPEWELPWDDDLRDGNDPETTREGHVEGW